jgi:hypothetical protein
VRVRLRLGGRPMDSSPAPRRGVGQVLAGAFHLLQDAAAVRQQPSAGFGERHAAAVAGKQGLAQIDFQCAHLAAERRLRDLQHGRGAREAAQFGHLHKGADLLEVHRLSHCYADLA